MNFSQALDRLKQGLKVSRSGWNGKGMFIFLISDSIIQPIEGKQMQPFIAIKSAQDRLVPWLASQEDLLAEDWGVVSY